MMMNATLATNNSLDDDWESYKAYIRFYYIADEIFLYVNPILILVGKTIIFKCNNKQISIIILI